MSALAVQRGKRALVAAVAFEPRAAAAPRVFVKLIVRNVGEEEIASAAGTAASTATRAASRLLEVVLDRKRVALFVARIFLLLPPAVAALSYCVISRWRSRCCRFRHNQRAGASNNGEAGDSHQLLKHISPSNDASRRNLDNRKRQFLSATDDYVSLRRTTLRDRPGFGRFPVLDRPALFSLKKRQMRSTCVRLDDGLRH